MHEIPTDLAIRLEDEFLWMHSLHLFVSSRSRVDSVTAERNAVNWTVKVCVRAAM